MSWPFYAAYIQQKDIIDSAIEKSIKESAEKLGKDSVNELFSITTISQIQKRVA